MAWNIDQYLIRQDERLQDASLRFEDARNRMLRMMTAGNAGGIVASLSLIGTTMRGGDMAVPGDFFVALIFFLLGLIACWLGQIAEWNRARTDVFIAYGNITKDDPIVDAKRRWTRFQNGVIAAAFGQLCIGIVWGMVAIYRLISF